MRRVGLVAAVVIGSMAFATPASAQDETTGTTTVAPLPTVVVTTTTIELSSPSTVAPPSSAPPTTDPAAPPTTVPTEVLGTVETNDGELAATGFADPAVAVAGLALVAAGFAVNRAARRR